MSAATFDELLAPRTGDELPRPIAHGERRSFGASLRALGDQLASVGAAVVATLTGTRYTPEPSTPKARFSPASSPYGRGSVRDHYLDRTASFHTYPSAVVAADGLNSGDFDADLFTWSEA